MLGDSIETYHARVISGVAAYSNPAWPLQLDGHKPTLPVNGLRILLRSYLLINSQGDVTTIDQCCPRSFDITWYALHVKPRLHAATEETKHAHLGTAPVQLGKHSASQGTDCLAQTLVQAWKLGLLRRAAYKHHIPTEVECISNSGMTEIPREMNSRK